MNDRIIKDLMVKIGDDVGATMRRTLAISPEPRLPVALSGGASAIALIAAFLDTDTKPEPDPDCMLLAGLLLGRIGPNQVEEAYRDFEILKAAGRTAASPSQPRGSEAE